MASGLSIVIDTRNAELNIKNLNQALERLETQGNSITNMMRNLGSNNPFAALTASINVTKSDFNALAASANMVKTTTKEMGDALVYAKTTLTGAATAATTFQAAMRGIGNSLNTAQAAMARFNQSGQSIATVLNSMNGSNGSNGVNNLNNAIKQLNPNIAALNNETKAVNASLRTFSSTAIAAETASNAFNDSVKKVYTSADILTKKIGALNGGFTVLSQKADTASSALSRFAQNATTTGSSMGGLISQSHTLAQNMANMGAASNTGANNTGTALARVNGALSNTQAQMNGFNNTARNTQNTFNQFNANIHNTQNNFTQLNNNVNLTRNSLTALSSVVTNNTTVINNYSRSAVAAAESTVLFQRSAQGLEATLMRLQTLMTGGLFGMAALSIAKTADAMQGLENQVRLVTQGEEQREEVQRRLLVIANKNFADIEATTGSYQRNAFALAQLGKSQMDVLNFTDALSLAMRTGGRSMLEQKSAVYQLSQAMGAGKLMGDEFRALSENAPIILKYIAKEMGVAQGALKELGSEGKITSEIIYNAMMKARPEMEKMAQSLPITMSQAWQQVNNSYKTFIDNFMNGTGGMSQGIASMLQGVGANFGAIANIIGGVVVVALSKYVASTVAATIATTGFTAANLSSIGTLTMMRGLTIAYNVQMGAIALSARAASLATGALAIATTPVSVAFARASASITAAAASLTRWSTYSGVAAAASTRLGAATVIATGAFARCAAILNAHPLMFLATVLFGVVASTEGVEGAMKSLGDAIGVVGYVLSDFIKAGVQGFGYLLNAAGGFVAGMVNGTKDGANKGTANLGVFFENTRGGFVGILQGVSRMVDAAIITITSTFTVAVRKLENFVIGVKNAYNNIQGFFGMENKQTGYIDSSLSTALGENYDKLGGSLTESLINNGIAQQDYQKQAKASADATAGLNSMIDANAAAIKRQADAAQASADAQKKLAKEQKALLNGARLVGVSGNSGIGTGAHLDIRVSGGGRRLTDAELARFQAGGKQLSAYRKTSEYGNRKAPTAGASTFHRGVDFAMPVGTPITTKVAIKDIKSFYDSKGGGYVQRILFADGLSVDLLHQSPKAQGIKGGASTGIAELDGMMSKLDNTYEKQAEKAAREQEQNLAKAIELRKEYGTKAQQIEADLAKKLEDIRNNTALSASEKDKFSTQAKVDAENELAIYRNTINQKISALLDFRKTQQQILDDKYAQDVFDAKHNKDLQGQDLTNYLDNLKTKYDFDTAANTANLQKQRNELTAYQKDERQLLIDSWNDKIADAKLKHGVLGQLEVDSLTEQSKRALEIFDLEQSQKLLDLQKFNMADIAYFEQTLKIKKELIAKSNATPEMQRAQNAAADYEAFTGIFDTRKSANDGYMSTYFDLYGQKDKYDAYKGVDDKRISQNDAVQKALDAGIIQHEEYYQTLKDIDAQYVASKQAILVGGYQSIFGTMTSLMKAFGGEQSRAYRVLASIEKGYALYKAFLNNKTAILDAYATTPGAWYTKAAAAAKVAIDTGAMTAAISAITPRGFSTGGYTGNMGVNDIAGVVHGKEYVLNAAATKRIGVDNLNAMNKGASIGNNNVSVNVVVNADGSSDVQANAQMGKQMGDAIKAAVLQTIVQEKRQGGLLAR